jgi:carbamoyl-phosphate synthase large subunit
MPLGFLMNFLTVLNSWGEKNCMPKDSTIQKIIIIGSGPIIIGQAAEFDYSGTQGCLALKEEGYETVLVNHNPATIMTDTNNADTVYCEPLTVSTLTKVIEKEKPDGLVANLGGQTALNLAVALSEAGVLEKYGVKLLGTSVESIQKGEDREQFRTLMNQLDEPIPESKIVTDVKGAIQFSEKIPFPIIVRPAYTLGGRGGGIAENEKEYLQLVQSGLKASPIGQILVEKSIAGYKEIEYEVMRDSKGNCISVCNMENFDPVGVHTGDSIVVAPSQTLTDEEFHQLRKAAFHIISSLEVVGGCNIQFAYDTASKNYYVIEVNPRVSRSSALASKATGYPIAKMAAKLAVGYSLDELINPLTGTTYASFEPALDYVVVKFPRWPFDKFPTANRVLGTKMKATGEVMAIERTLEAAFQKAVQSLELDTIGLRLKETKDYTEKQLKECIQHPTDLRFFALFELMKRGASIDKLHQETEIDLFFLSILKNIITLEEQLNLNGKNALTKEQILKAKRFGFDDKTISFLTGVEEKEIVDLRSHFGLSPSYKMVDTCAAEFEAATNYAYSTYFGSNEIQPLAGEKKALIVGAGPIRIGQGVEFDYSAVKAIKTLQRLGWKAVMVNNNPETVSTDYETADRLYFEPLTKENILSIIQHEEIDAVLVQFGGQTAINLAESLEEAGVKLLGTSSGILDKLEDRELFYALLDELQISHVKGDICHSKAEAVKVASDLQYPLLCRPSYVIGGTGMVKVTNANELHQFLQEADESFFPILLDEYMVGKEAEVDLVADGNKAWIPGVMEHIERAGVHSGDSMAIFPSTYLSDKVTTKIEQYANKIVSALGYKGIMNIQFLIVDNRVLVLEVNPRASRTIPIISKVKGISLIDLATEILCDESKTVNHFDQTFEQEIVAVKFPVFSTHAHPEIDLLLGANMKSTGEGMCVGKTVEEALYKVFEVLHHSIDNGGTVMVDSIDSSLTSFDTSNSSDFEAWIEAENASLFYSDVNTEEGKQRRIKALEQGVTVITEKETLFAFSKSRAIKGAEPVSLTTSTKFEGVR